MDEKAPKIDDKKFAAHMNKNKKTKTMNSTQKSLKDIRGRADSIVRSKKSTAQMRNKAGLKKVGEEMENMCCKNCGDMYGKPTKENKSCMYDAYNREGKNWIKKESYREAVITPKMQKRALASPAAKAKPKSQVSLKKAPFKIPSKDDMKEMIEAFDFRVNIDGFPEMFMSGNSPSEVKTNLRKLVKQPSMIQSVDRVTKADKKKHHRDKVKESLDEARKSQGMFIVLEKGSKNKVIGQSKDKQKAIDMMKKNAGSKVIQIGKFATTDGKPVDVKVGDELSHTRVKLATKIKEEVELDEASKTVQSMMNIVDKKQAMKIDGVMVDMFTASAVTQIYNKVNDANKAKMDKMKATQLANVAMKLLKKESVEEGNGLWANIRAKRARGEKMRKKGEKGAPTQDQIKRAQGEAVSPAQQAAIAISKKEKSKKDEGAMSRIASTGSTLKKPKGLDTFRKKPNETYAPDEGTPEAKKKASKMTPGQEGVGSFFKSVGNKIMGNKPTANQTRQRVNTNRGSTSGQQNSIANRINFGGKYGNK